MTWYLHCYTYFITYFLDKDCGSSEHNVLRSPGYPDKYSPYNDCVYRVFIQQGMAIEISFIHFNLEQQALCG